MSSHLLVACAGVATKESDSSTETHTALAVPSGMAVAEDTAAAATVEQPTVYTGMPPHQKPTLAPACPPDFEETSPQDFETHLAPLRAYYAEQLHTRQASLSNLNLDYKAQLCSLAPWDQL